MRKKKRNPDMSNKFGKNYPYSMEEFQDYVISFLDRRIRNYTLSHIINYCGMVEYDPKVIRYIQQYPDEFRNLFNDGWWRSQHNEEELEMRRHPNRSQRWIGHRLEKRRNNLIKDLFRNVRGVDLMELMTGLCPLCGLMENIDDMRRWRRPSIQEFCPSCWQGHIRPYLQNVIAYSLDSNPN